MSPIDKKACMQAEITGDFENPACTGVPRQRTKPLQTQYLAVTQQRPSSVANRRGKRGVPAGKRRSKGATPSSEPPHSSLRECGSPSAEALATVASRYGLRCRWVCIRSALFCLSAKHAHHVAQRVLAQGVEWEAGCKELVRSHIRFDGQDAAVAGLFGGDWLPLISNSAGPRGLVFGFEPTDAVNVSNAVTDANQLSNVRVRNACLSNVSATMAFCTRLRDGGGAFGDRAHIVPGSRQVEASSSDGVAATGISLGGRECLVDNIQCVSLDEVLPWRERRVGFILLDVEGHEEQALWGAAQLTRRWRPIIASELNLEANAQHLYRTHLQPLGYSRLRGRASRCGGLYFYGPAK